MSLTLPYASAVNCKFVALPDSLATDDNTLKLYNIDGGGGGGGGDAYTKSESDARFLQVAAATPQTVSQLPLFANGIKLHNFLKLSLVQGSLTQMIDMRPYTVDETQTAAFLIHSRPSTNQYIYKKPLIMDYVGGSPTNAPLTIKNFAMGGGIELLPTAIAADTPYMKFSSPSYVVQGSIYHNGAGIVYKGDSFIGNAFVLSGNATIRASFNSGNMREVWLPSVNAGCELVVNRPTGPQSIENTLNLNGPTTVNNSFVTQTLKFSGTEPGFSKAVNVISAEDEITTGRLASSSAVCNWTKNYAIPKTDIVATVTGVSDNKVPSEWAVKRYVDANGSANAILKTDLVTTVTGDSDSKVPSEKAVKTYVDSLGNNSYVSIIHQYSPSYPVPENYLQRLGFSQFTLHVENIGTLDQTVPLFSWACPLNRNIRIKIEGNSYRVAANDVIQTLITKNFYQHSFVANTTPYQVLASGNYTVYDTTKDYPMFVSDMVNNQLICNFRAFVPVTYSTFTISIWVTDIN